MSPSHRSAARSAALLLWSGVLSVTVFGVTPRPRATLPNPVLPTPKYIPSTQSPRFFLAGNGDTLLVWTFRNPPERNGFAYYYIDQSGTIGQFRYDVDVVRSNGELHLTLVRNGLRCRGYRAKFRNDEQTLWVYNSYVPDYNLANRAQPFSVMDNRDLSTQIQVLQEGAAQQAAIYREMLRRHYHVNPRSYFDVDPWFAPNC